jgi:hypothetical protein
MKNKTTGTLNSCLVWFQEIILIKQGFLTCWMNFFRIMDPWGKSSRSRIRIRNTGICNNYSAFNNMY